MRPRATWWRPATSALTRSRIAVSSRSAAVCSTCFRRTRIAPCGSTYSAMRSRRCAGSPPSPSGRSATPSWSRWRPPRVDQDQPFSIRAHAAEIAARGLKAAEPELEKLARSGYRTVIAFARHGEGERVAYNLGRLKVRWLDESDGAQASDRLVTFVQARLQAGFIAPQFHLAVIPEHRLFRRRRAPERPGGGRLHRRGVLRSFADLRTGDIVVHEDHGIARFAGFDTKTVANVTRDYLYLEYAGSDRVFVPVDQLAKISRYVGAGGSQPPLSKLGGTRWDTLKARARRAAQELAGELLK